MSCRRTVSDKRKRTNIQTISIVISACVFPNKKEIKVNNYALINEDYYACEADLVNIGNCNANKIAGTIICNCRSKINTDYSFICCRPYLWSCSPKQKNI